MYIVQCMLGWYAILEFLRVFSARFRVSDLNKKLPKNHKKLQLDWITHWLHSTGRTTISTEISYFENNFSQIDQVQLLHQSPKSLFWVRKSCKIHIFLPWSLIVLRFFGLIFGLYLLQFHINDSRSCQKMRKKAKRVRHCRYIFP